MNKSVNELQVVQILSALTIPEHIVRDSNIRELMEGMVAETKSVQDENNRLKQLRQEKKTEILLLIYGMAGMTRLKTLSWTSTRPWGV